MSDSFGRRPIALAGLLLIAGSRIGCAFAPNFQKAPTNWNLRELVPILTGILRPLPNEDLQPRRLGVAIWRYHPLHSLGNYPAAMAFLV